MSRARMLSLAVVAALASATLVAGPAHAATYTLSGVVRDASGAPVAGIGVDWRVTVVAQSGLTTTAPDGSFTMSVPSGEQAALFVVGDYLGEDLYARTESFVMSGNRTENATLPLGATARVTVVDGDGSPVAGATVRSADRFALTPTSGGLSLISRFDKDTCVTSASGVCDFVSFRGGSIEYFDVTAPGSTETAHLTGMDTPDAVDDKQLVVAVVSVTGVVRANDGSPVAGATVQLVRNGVTRTTTSAADGQFTFSVLAGDGAVLTITGTVAEGSRSGPFTLTTSPFSIAGARHEVVTLPSLTTLAIHVVDSLGSPVPDASVTLGNNASTSAGSTSSGVAFSVALFPWGTERCAQTDSSGACDVVTFRGGSSPGFDVARPDHVVQSFPGLVTDADPTVVVARLIGYASAGSAGTRTGSFLMTTSFSSNADISSLVAAPVSLPDGLEPLVGRIDYRVSLAPGATTRLGFTLPAPAYANDLVRVTADGHVVDDVGSADGLGSTVSRTVTDGSASDADGVVNGVITGSIIPVLRAPLLVATGSLPGAVPGYAYSAQLAGTGPVAPYSWSISGGSLPPGLALSAAGAITGTPTSLGTWTFEVTMRESTGSGEVARRTLTLTVAKVAVATTTLPDGYVGGAYRVELERIGTGFATWKRYGGGGLPPGLQMSRTGVIAGTPTTAGSYEFDVVVSSNGESGPPQRLVLVVRQMEVATTVVPSAPIGATYAQQLTTLGGKGTLHWSVVDGALPPGLTLSSSGALSGRPTAVGSYDVTVRVTDASTPMQVATRTLTIVVTPMAIVTSTLPTGRKGAWYSIQLVASGGKPTLTWSLTSGTLPTGLRLSAGGKVSGYPKATGTWTFTVKVADASTPANQAIRTVSITVA